MSGRVGVDGLGDPTEVGDIQSSNSQNEPAAVMILSIIAHGTTTTVRSVIESTSAVAVTNREPFQRPAWMKLVWRRHCLGRRELPLHETAFTFLLFDNSDRCSQASARV